MAGPCNLLNFRQVETFYLLVLTSVLGAECPDMIDVVGTAELPDYFLSYIPTDVFAIVGLIFLLLLFYLPEEFETSEVIVGGVVWHWRLLNTDDEGPGPFCLDGLAEQPAY